MPSPVAHATGLVVGVLVPLTVGAQTHLLDVWEPHEGLRRIEQYRCTATATATPFVRMALDAQRVADRDLSSMRFWLCAGAPIPEALAIEFNEAFDGGVLMPLDPDGWHHTGDLGRFDDQGYLRVTGRLKDIIIRGGTNISAGEVEGYVAAHPAVAQVAVVAYPDARLGEKACAIVVPEPGEQPALEDITRFLRGRGISLQKLPEKLLLIDDLPMTATGKIQKFRLREMARGL